MAAPVLAASLLVVVPRVGAQSPPLVPDEVAVAFASELSGETAQRHLEFVTRQHRMRGSSGYRAAADHIVAALRAYGLADATVLEFPADGRTFYGTQKARPAWDAEFAEIWTLTRVADRWARHERLASWHAMPVSLAQDSDAGEVTTMLVDVGAGTSEGDYAGRDVRGKIVLAAAQPEAVAPLAVDRFGAAGIVSYAQNQRSAWWGENEHLVRWGHLDSFAERQTFAFMVSPGRARGLRDRLAGGEEIRLEAVVRAARRPGTYDVVTATIPGADASRRDEEIAFSCHLDHQRPGANDNASGCVAILEVARTWAKLIREGRVAPPARTVRFIWPPEIEGTLALLNARPDIASRIRAVVHMDMVGGRPHETKAILHITRGPASLPSFVNDVAEAIGAFVNEQTKQFAATGEARFPLVAPEGGKEAWLAHAVEFTLGSDHQVYTDSSFGIPAVYLNDWPDRYIHTNFDQAANIDPTKLKRAAFLGATTAGVLASFGPDQVDGVLDLLRAAALRRVATLIERRAALEATEAAILTRHHFDVERALVTSIERFTPLPSGPRDEAAAFLDRLERLVGGPSPPPAAPSGDAALVFHRNPELRGPMWAFGYSYFEDHHRGAPVRLLGYRGLRGAGGDYAYECLNLVNGRYTVRDIRDRLSATFGPVSLDLVLEYLRALEAIGVVRR